LAGFFETFEDLLREGEWPLGQGTLYGDARIGRAPAPPFPGLHPEKIVQGEEARGIVEGKGEILRGTVVGEKKKLLFFVVLVRTEGPIAPHAFGQFWLRRQGE